MSKQSRHELQLTGKICDYSNLEYATVLKALYQIRKAYAKVEYELFCQIRELTRGHTAIFISHRFSTVRLADRILVLENGSVIEYGNHVELLALDSYYAELFNLQAGSYR